MTTSISTSAMLVSLNLSSYSGAKQDRQVAAEIDYDKNTQTRAGRYTKNLFADVPQLKAIIQHDAHTRQLHRMMTMPWSYDGVALLPAAMYMVYVDKMNLRQQERKALVSDFVQQYSTIVSMQAFKLGDLFNRDEYPDTSEIEFKFDFAIRFSPLPDAGDFRIDIGNEGIEELRQQYEDQQSLALTAAMADLRGRLQDILHRLVLQLRDVPEGEKRPRIYESLLGNARELVDLLPAMNVTKDLQLTAARDALLDAIDGVTTDELRDDDMMRRGVRDTAQELLDKWGW